MKSEIKVEKVQLSVPIPKYLRAELKAMAAFRDLKMGDMVAELIVLESEKQKNAR